MKARIFAASLAAASAFVALPAAAQVSGVAVTDPAIAIASATALQNGFNQVATTFQAQRTQVEQIAQQRETLLRQFDTNNDGQLSEQEQTAAQGNTAVLQQIQGLEQQIGQIQAPMTQARIYVVEQLLTQYSAALQQVTSQNSVQLVLNPSNVVWAGPAVDITQKVVAALNTLVPTVSTSVPQGWQPQRQSVAVYQEVSEILQAAMAQRAQQQGQAAPAAAPAQQPVGR